MKVFYAKLQNNFPRRCTAHGRGLLSSGLFSFGKVTLRRGLFSAPGIKSQSPKYGRVGAWRSWYREVSSANNSCAAFMESWSSARRECQRFIPHTATRKRSRMHEVRHPDSSIKINTYVQTAQPCAATRVHTLSQTDTHLQTLTHARTDIKKTRTLTRVYIQSQQPTVIHYKLAAWYQYM